MVRVTQSGPETLPVGSKGPDFSLPGTDGNTYSLDSFSGSEAIVLSFTCNHCPYAQAYDDRFISLAHSYGPKGIAFAAICSNDAKNYPDDRFEKMVERAAEKGFPYPYLHDASQETARAYGAVCTPHFFVLNPKRERVYEGRLDDNWQEPDSVTSSDLQGALEAILAGEEIPQPNTNPMGCSIKWIA